MAKYKSIEEYLDKNKRFPWEENVFKIKPTSRKNTSKLDIDKIVKAEKIKLLRIKWLYLKKWGFI